MRGRRLPKAALAFFLLLSTGPAASQEVEERPQIFFEKKVYSESVGGKRSFYETHVVEKGETLWKILGRSRPLSPERYAEKLKDFVRTNPQIKDPSRLSPGQEIVVPSGVRDEGAEVGKTFAYRVEKGDTLSGIYVSRGAPGPGLKEFLEAVREINPSIDNVDRIFAGRMLRLPA
ncbi:MAG: LysM peptidoglycan-binding domain-containing protein, partial [Deltaproteobacteria bacterium]|nr:LysM peptidoglycan-binding domain-containing protein [Deltaproteobacteria bacterium]